MATKQVDTMAVFTEEIPATRFRHARVHVGYGIGFRLSLGRAARFRVDLGSSKDGIQVAAGFGPPFRE